MPDAIEIVEVTGSNVKSLPCCGIKDPAHAGRCEKQRWMERHLKKGLRVKALMENGKPRGHIEYLPGEHAWRGVSAPGYLFIHCIWTFSKQAEHRGVATQLLRDCQKEAKLAGMRGVAVLARDGPWLASSAVFLKNGFKVVATAEPDYQLLAWKVDAAAPDPAFKGDYGRKLKKYCKGLTIIRSQQCPHIAKFADDIAAAANEYGLKPKVVELKSARDAQDAPTPYAVFAVIYDGRLLADRQISATRFRNIMRAMRRK